MRVLFRRDEQSFPGFLGHGEQVRPCGFAFDQHLAIRAVGGQVERQTSVGGAQRSPNYEGDSQFRGECGSTFGGHRTIGRQSQPRSADLVAADGQQWIEVLHLFGQQSRDVVRVVLIRQPIIDFVERRQNRHACRRCGWARGGFLEIRLGNLAQILTVLTTGLHSAFQSILHV